MYMDQQSAAPSPKPSDPLKELKMSLAQWPSSWKTTPV
jgi:hypothetical protein